MGGINHPERVGLLYTIYVYVYIVHYIYMYIRVCTGLPTWFLAYWLFMSGTAHSLTLLRLGPGTSILGKWNEQGSWQSTAVPRILQLGWTQDPLAPIFRVQHVEFGHASCFICFYPPIRSHPLLKNVNGKHPPKISNFFPAFPRCPTGSVQPRRRSLAHTHSNWERHPETWVKIYMVYIDS